MKIFQPRIRVGTSISVHIGGNSFFAENLVISSALSVHFYLIFDTFLSVFSAKPPFLALFDEIFPGFYLWTVHKEGAYVDLVKSVTNSASVQRIWALGKFSRLNAENYNFFQ